MNGTNMQAASVSNSLNTQADTIAVQLKYLEEIKDKADIIKEHLTGATARVADPSQSKISSPPNGILDRIITLNQMRDLIQHQIMGTLTEIEKALLG